MFGYSLLDQVIKELYERCKAFQLEFLLLLYTFCSLMTFDTPCVKC